MNTQINDRVSAFPWRQEFGGGGYLQHEGMSLRDWFAGNALHSLSDAYPADFLEDDSTSGHTACATCRNRAAAAYAIADAMLAAREKKGGS